jgi:hypothetical protein
MTFELTFCNNLRFIYWGFTTRRHISFHAIYHVFMLVKLSLYFIFGQRVVFIAFLDNLAIIQSSRLSALTRMPAGTPIAA